MTDVSVYNCLLNTSLKMYESYRRRSSNFYPSKGFTAPGKWAPKLSSLIVWLTCTYSKCNQKYMRAHSIGKSSLRNILHSSMNKPSSTMCISFLHQSQRTLHLTLNFRNCPQSKWNWMWPASNEHQYAKQHKPTNYNDWILTDNPLHLRTSMVWNIINHIISLSKI